MKRHQGVATILVVALVMGIVLPVSSQPAQDPDTEPIPNRYLAFGDSITWGGIEFTPYPALLESTLDIRVAQSEVINAGKPGEVTYDGKARITGLVSEHKPQYVLIMEGTNDVTRGKDPEDVKNNLITMISNARETAGVDNVHVMLATLIPRLDDRNEETAIMNEEAIFPAAAAAGVPVCNQWVAFGTYPHWAYLFVDKVHLNQQGLQLLANTFYDCALFFFPELHEETTPPTTWIEPLPAESECSQVAVSWDGTDNLNWVVDYDLQAQINDGPWTDWTMATQAKSGTYTGGFYGDRLGFRVRGRDFLGNQADYGDPAYTQVDDNVPPYEAHVNPLPPIVATPFAVSWWGADACADIVAYDVQYRAGTVGEWQNWLISTPYAGGFFDLPDLEYGQTYYFRALPQDEAGNWGCWSDPLEAYTLLARFSVAGYVENVRGQPVAGAEVNFVSDPAPVETIRQPAGFLAYMMTEGDYEISVSRPDLYGGLPAMHNQAAIDHVAGLEFVLPPHDDTVSDGGFEAGNLGAWLLGGVSPPALTGTAHTGQYAVRLGGGGLDSHLSQSISPGAAMSDPTLSFMARLEEAGPPNTLQIVLSGGVMPAAPMTYTLVVEDANWVHAWYDLAGLVSDPLTVTLVVDGGPALLVDEVSLGSALPGGYLVYLPVLYRGW